MKAAVVLIGDELLTGKTADRNGALAIELFRAQGVTLRSLCVIPDEVALIAETIGREAARVDIVVTSGGVGPTHDDKTMEGVARAFGVDLVPSAAMRAHIERQFEGEPEGARSAWLKMADLPVGSELLEIDGERWPVTRLENVYILPGIPENFRRQLLGLRGRFLGSKVFLRTIFMGVGEGRIAAPLGEAAERFAGVSFGSYPVVGGAGWSVRVTVESVDAAAVEAASSWLLGRFGGDEVVGVLDGDGQEGP